MRDIKVSELADEAAENFPGIPKEVVRYLCNSVMQSILKVVKIKDGRIRIQHGDIHTIYYDIVPSEQRALLADLDESRVLTKQEEELFISQRAQNKNIRRTLKRLNRNHKRAHYTRFNSSTLYPT